MIICSFDFAKIHKKANMSQNNSKIFQTTPINRLKYTIL